MNSNFTKITTIGGGTGSPVVIRGLVKAGFQNISAISASMDSGGKTGIIRSDERDRVIAISDLLRNLLALVSDKQNHLNQVCAFTDLAGFVDGRSRNLGYTLYYALLEKYQGDFLKVQNHLEKLLGIKLQGTAIPVTTKSANICFSTASGLTHCGEHELDRQSMSTDTIQKIWLDHPVSATPEAISAIIDANWIIYSPGSVYGSVLSNFLPTGITAALKKTHAKKILISNLVSNRNQTHQFSPLDYLKLFQNYTHLKKPFDYFLCPHLSEIKFDAKYPKVANTYATEHSHFLGWDDNQLKSLTALGIKVFQVDTFYITQNLSRIRHDPDKLATVFKKLLRL